MTTTKLREALMGLRKHGVTSGTHQQMMLYLHEHGEARMTDLERECVLSGAGITCAVDTLESRGLLERSRDHHLDRRVIMIRLTSQGERAIAEALASMTRKGGAACR